MNYQSVINTIEYEFVKDIFSAFLEAIMVKTEFEEQIPTGEKDEEGLIFMTQRKSLKMQNQIL